MALHVSISSLRRSSRGRESGVLGVLAVVLELLEDEVLFDEDEEEVDVEEAFGFSPSFRAFSRAFTSSLFSRKLFVLMPYDSSSFLISPARIVEISGSVEAHSREPTPRVMVGTTKDRTRRLEVIKVYITRKRNTCDLEADDTMVVLLLGVCVNIRDECREKEINRRRSKIARKL